MSQNFSADKLSDNDIVALALEDKENFLYIINRYKLKIFNFIRRITNISEDDAQDLSQEIFLKVYLNLNDFDNKYKFSSWIYSIARHQVISSHRRLKARPEGYSEPINDEIAKILVADLNIEKAADQALLKRNIGKVLSGLDKKYREVLVLRFLEEKSYNEISDIIKKPVGTVGSLMNKAKSEFKKELERNKIMVI